MTRPRQIPGELPRRWFNDPDMDLMVWMHAGGAVGFQLAYDKGGAEKAVTWRARGGLDHAGVDSGEGRAGKAKASPILVADGPLDGWHVCGEFLRASAQVPGDLRGLVCRVLTSASGNAG